MVPSLLPAGKSGEIKRRAFEDLQLHKLLTGHAVEILSRPCDAAAIAGRQQFFRALGEGMFLDKIKSFRSALRELDRVYSLYTGCKIRAERLFLFVCVLKRFAEARGLAAALADNAGEGAAAPLLP